MADNITTETEKAAAVQAVASAAPSKMVFALSQDAGEAMEKAGYEKTDPASPLMYALQQASGSATKKAPRLAFTENPAPSDNYLGLYKSKRRLLPDEVLKQIRIQDHLVAAILRARGSMMSLFGHLRKDRFDVGVEVSLKQEFYDILTPEQFAKATARMKRFESLLLNCGHTAGLEHQDKMTLAQYIDIQCQNGLNFGRFATEVIYDRESEPDEDGNYPFHRFRPVDVATIYRAVRKGEYVGNNLREIAMRMLESITGDKPNINLARLKEDHYAWLQVIDGTPRQAFTHEEMLVFNLFPCTDIEMNGYPVSPLDTCVSSVTTHISIDAYKKLYFQNGRASKGMLVIKSDEIDEAVLNGIKMQFNASINNVSNSFRTPIFGMGIEDEVAWVPFTGEGLHDGDFQFMYDQIARNIMSAFSMAPDELPGYSHLTRGTNSQTLSESNNEFKLTAARDTGLRPLILKFQTFFNEILFPIIDPLLAKICEVKFSGIDAESKEQESTRLAQDMPTHMTYDEVLHKVDKDPVGRHMAGEFPFNERWQLILDKYKNVGEIMGEMLGDNSAIVDPLLRYKRDPFHLQWLQLMAQVNPGAVMAYLAPRPFAMEMLKMCVQDSLEGEENVSGN
jgi:phage portal protein BeeE